MQAEGCLIAFMDAVWAFRHYTILFPQKIDRDNSELLLFSPFLFVKHLSNKFVRPRRF